MSATATLQRSEVQERRVISLNGGVIEKLLAARSPWMAMHRILAQMYNCPHLATHGKTALECFLRQAA